MPVRQQMRRTPRASPSGAAPALTIPFDHAVQFKLNGVPGRVVEGIITTDTDGVFVAESIAYSFEPRRSRDIRLRNIPANPIAPSSITLSQIPPRGLVGGFRIRPSLVPEVFPDPLADGPDGPPRRYAWDNTVTLPSPVVITNLIETVDDRREAPFLFSMIDTVTGRELQDEPTHSVASLGAASGVRPFRRLAQPLSFQPRSTLRIQITELAAEVAGTLFIVLQGYKTLSATACAGVPPLALPGQALQQGMLPDGRVVPFDYVASFELRGEPARRETVEIPVNAEGGFIATSIGYGLQVPEQDVLFDVDPAAPVVNPASTDWNLNQLRLGDFPPDALVDGVRIRPEMVRLAFRNNGTLDNNFDINLVPLLFERLNKPEDVLFRYEIHDTGTGRHLQSRPINNIAGLGSAEGKRPFRSLARPLLMMPRSALRVTVEERFGRGRLFIVFQGIKVLNAGRL